MKATLIDSMGTDLSVVNAARVSFGKKSDWEYGGIAQEVLPDKDTKLIHYLAKNKHTSPFGHCFASFHVEAPIFVARQLVKHKFLRWNEISRRYVDEEPEFYEPESFRGRAANVKQGSSDEKIDGESVLTYGDTGYTDVGLNELCVCWYKDALKKGVAPEQARMVLPQSTYTEWYWSGSLDAFADMCNLRCKEDTQWETRQVANQIDEEMGKLYPVAWEALRAYGD
jgi:thymidylate synthase (FAD)